jgi:hypothetical protein
MRPTIALRHFHGLNRTEGQRPSARRQPGSPNRKTLRDRPSPRAPRCRRMCAHVLYRGVGAHDHWLPPYGASQPGPML